MILYITGIPFLVTSLVIRYLKVMINKITICLSFLEPISQEGMGEFYYFYITSFMVDAIFINMIFITNTIILIIMIIIITYVITNVFDVFKRKMQIDSARTLPDILFIIQEC